MITCRAERYRAELIDALMLVQRGVVRPNQLRGAWAGELGQTQFMPSAIPDVCDHSRWRRWSGSHTQFCGRSRLDRQFPA